MGFVILVAMETNKLQSSEPCDWDKERIQAQWHAFDFMATQPLSEIEACYSRHYQSDFSVRIPGVQHRFGFVEVDEFQLATHYYCPSESPPQATVLILHGYFDHSGLYAHLIEFCLQRQYAVLIYDLPGHGLSTGETGEINDFHEYVRVLAHFVGLHQHRVGVPCHVVGISTGGAIIMEYLAAHEFNADTSPFASTLLLAPLVRPVEWLKLRLMYLLLRPFVKSVARTFVSSSHDADFVYFVEHADPLQNRRVAVNWVGALIQWVKRFHQVRLDLSPVIIQGGEDETIDWRFNLKFIERAFDRPLIHFIPQARHQLANESVDIRRQVFEFMALYLPFCDDTQIKAVMVEQEE